MHLTNGEKLSLFKDFYANAPRMTAEEIDKIASVFIEQGIKKSDSPVANL